MRVYENPKRPQDTENYKVEPLDLENGYDIKEVLVRIPGKLETRAVRVEYVKDGMYKAFVTPQSFLLCDLIKQEVTFTQFTEDDYEQAAVSTGLHVMKIFDLEDPNKKNNKNADHRFVGVLLRKPWN